MVWEACIRTSDRVLFPLRRDLITVSPASLRPAESAELQSFSPSPLAHGANSKRVQDPLVDPSVCIPDVGTGFLMEQQAVQGEGEGKKRNGAAAAALSLSLSYPIPSPVSVLQGSSRDFRRLITSRPPPRSPPERSIRNQPWSESDIHTSAGFRSPGAVRDLVVFRLPMRVELEMLTGCQSPNGQQQLFGPKHPVWNGPVSCSWGRGPSSQLNHGYCLVFGISCPQALVKTSSKTSYNRYRLSKQQHTKTENGWWTLGTGPRVRPPVQPNLDLLPLLLPLLVMWGPWTLGKPEGLCFAKKRRPSALRGPTGETCDMFPTGGLAHCPSGRRTLGVVSQAEELPSCAACLWPKVEAFPKQEGIPVLDLGMSGTGWEEPGREERGASKGRRRGPGVVVSRRPSPLALDQPASDQSLQVSDIVALPNWVIDSGQGNELLSRPLNPSFCSFIIAVLKLSRNEVPAKRIQSFPSTGQKQEKVYQIAIHHKGSPRNARLEVLPKAEYDSSRTLATSWTLLLALPHSCR
ncbi:uncharacterized protein CLUP02_16081 [Colletotrichum lupini]|uniref:Uncharacterized protein n=1 Tax=Colletotrichum lupini TaxID=145971 RepID=A0A9Q8T9J0_9PEZI|nr:uncharacterized protein CLUP02_16081 [Colletotrichum lupini]UQC90551.1 hypothetical protein CLUP02_16081 [Colletotrichum lupini]